MKRQRFGRRTAAARRAALAVALLAGLAIAVPDAEASWARMSLSELIRYSEIIATGTIVDFERVPDPSGTGAMQAGIVQVERVLKGPAGLDRVRLMVPRPAEPQAAETINYEVGDTGLWFLRLLDGAPEIFAADHPQRHAGPKDAARMMAEIEAALGQ